MSNFIYCCCLSIVRRTHLSSELIPDVTSALKGFYCGHSDLDFDLLEVPRFLEEIIPFMSEEDFRKISPDCKVVISKE